MDQFPNVVLPPNSSIAHATFYLALNFPFLRNAVVTLWGEKSGIAATAFLLVGMKFIL